MRPQAELGYGSLPRSCAWRRGVEGWPSRGKWPAAVPPAVPGRRDAFLTPLPPLVTPHRALPRAAGRLETP
jgi:hypothetical protein